MNLRSIAIGTGIVLTLSLAVVPVTTGQAGSEAFTATATVTTAGGAAATAPVAVAVDRIMPESEVARFLAAFKSGGASALRKSLTGVAPTGSIRIGNGKATPTRLTLERVTDKGRLLTMVTDTPILFLGAGLPDAKPKSGYDFGILDIEVDQSGRGSGTLAPAAKVTVKQGVFVVDDYGAELIRLTGVKRK